NAGSAIMGIGVAAGENRATEAAEQAISSPLLESGIEGARGVLLNISASSALTLDELYSAANVVQGAISCEDAFIITGCVIDDSLGEEVRVTVLATGFPSHAGPNAVRADAAQAQRPAQRPVQQRPAAPPAQQGMTPAGPPVQQQASGDELDIPPFLRSRRG